MPRSFRRSSRRWFAVLVAFAAATTAPAQSGAVDFPRDVRPILAAHCYACHGPDAAARKADLRLDRREEALAARDGSAAIVPGDPAASALWQRVTSSDPDDVMPPPDAHKPLAPEQKERLRQW
ncbi:MAG: c-type cytochrome domain-containing protein, partial [Planctomycetota bacterium]